MLFGVRWQAERDTALDLREQESKAPPPLRSVGALQISLYRPLRSLSGKRVRRLLPKTFGPHLPCNEFFDRVKWFLCPQFSRFLIFPTGHSILGLAPQALWLASAPRTHPVAMLRILTRPLPKGEERTTDKSGPSPSLSQRRGRSRSYLTICLYLSRFAIYD